MFKKLKNKTQECIKHIKTMFYTKLAVSLRKKDDICLGYVDWYEQHSWFERKWFKHKLKRLIMRNVYKFIDKLDDVLFEKYHETYYVEFKIHLDENSYLIGEIPLLLKIRDGEEIETIIGSISIKLTKSIGYYVTLYNVKKIKNGDDLNTIINEMEINFRKYSAIGEITFLTGLFKPKIEIKNIIPLTINPDDIPSNYKILNKQMIEFGIIETKNKRNYINSEDKFQILIKFHQEIKKVLDDEPKEIRIDRIKELMGLKPINNNTEK